jgi:hypothetical protein
MNSYITSGGLIVINRLLATQGPLTFTRAQLGSGVVTSVEAARARTSLITPVVNAEIYEVRYEGGEAVVSIQYSNAALAQGFWCKELGIFCRNPDNPAQEILYGYTTFGDTSDWIAARSALSNSVYTRLYKPHYIVSDVNEVSFTVTPGLMVSKEEFDRGVAQIMEIETADAAALWQYARAKLGHTPYTLDQAVDEIHADSHIRDIDVAALRQTLRAKTGHTDLTLQQADAALTALTADSAAQLIDVTLTEANTQGYPFTNKKQTVALSPAREHRVHRRLDAGRRRGLQLRRDTYIRQVNQWIQG